MNTTAGAEMVSTPPLSTNEHAVIFLPLPRTTSVGTFTSAPLSRQNCTVAKSLIRTADNNSDVANSFDNKNRQIIEP